MSFDKLQPPSKIKLNTKNISDNWPKWREEFELYVALTMKDQAETVKIQMLKYLIGSEGREIYVTLKHEKKEEKDRTIKQVLDAFDDYCKPKKNEIVERYRFNMRKQDQGEMIETFITDVKTQAAKCNYGQLVDSLVRDRIVCGIVDSHLRERLLRTHDLDLDRCVDMCRAAEITKQGISVLDGGACASGQTEVHKVTKTKGKRKSGRTSHGKTCKFCGRIHELKKESCPAFGQECHKCHDFNHFQSKCDSLKKNLPVKPKPVHSKGPKKQVHKLEFADYTDESDDDYFTYTVTMAAQDKVHSAHAVSNTVHATMLVQGQEVKFQLDTGATCNIIPSKVLETMPTPQPTNDLKMYNGSTMKSKGKICIDVTNPKNNVTYQTEFVVINEDCVPLLGNRTLQDMQLMEWKDENILSVGQYVPLSKEQIFTEFPEVFHGTGKFEGKYHLVVDEGVEPVVHPPRKVPVALKPLLKKEPSRLEAMNIIAPVSEPTPWVSSCLMVVKPNKVRICIDPKDLNKALKRSHYPLPTIDDVLPNLSRAKVFK